MMDKSDRLRPVIMDAARGPVHLQRLRTTLARLERSDGMSLAELLTEAESRISHETTLIAIFQKPTPETLVDVDRLRTPRQSGRCNHQHPGHQRF